MFFTSKPKPKFKGVENLDKSISNFIPYLCHYNDNTIITKNGDLMSVIKLSGFSFETADDDILDGKKYGRNNLIKGIANSNFSVYFHTVRRKHSAYPDGEFGEDFTKMLNEQWKLKHNPEYTFTNEHYVTIVRKSSGKLSMLKNLINFLDEDEGSAKSKALKEAYTEFEEVRDRMVNGLWPYKIKLLSTYQENNTTYCEIMEFLSFIVNGGKKQKVLYPKISIDKYIAQNRLFFSSKNIEVSGNDYEKYAGIVSLKEYRPATFAGIMDGFLHLPYEIVITQSFSFTDRMTSIAKMQLQQRRLVQSEDVAVSQIQEINEALDSAMSGAFGFGEHHLSVMCLADNPKALDTALSQVVVEFANSGINAVRERMNTEAAFWAQLPCNFDFIVRKATINTLNLASYASFHNYPSGKAKGNYWGDAITVFNTTSGTSYFFSFHARDVGHTMIIGPTGAGKTVLLNFLCAQAQKFHPRTFFFDKDRGAEIFIRSVGGRYTVIDPANSTNFNPMQLEDTADNRNFLNELLKVLVTTNGEPFTADDASKINAAIEGNYKLKFEDRKLSNIAPFLGLESPGSLAGRLRMWHSDGAKAKIFDNDVDDIDFKKGKVFGFEMANILKDKAVLPAALLYVFHRINSALDGTPTMIILDEAWALIDNPVFAPKIKDWLKVLRKLNAFVVFATQSVEDASKSQISDTLVQQTATQIFLPNLKATAVYKEVFMLTEREFAIVKNTDPSSRYFLIKQDSDGVIARIDLQGMTDAVNVLSGRATTVALLQKIISQVGEDPRQWLPIFIREARNET